LPAAHRALGYYYYWGHRDYEAALEAFGRAAEDLPNDSQVREGIAYIRRRQGRFDDAVRELEKALELDPESSRVAAELGQTLMVLRRYEQADHLYARAIDLAPDEPIPFQQRSLNLLLWRGDLVGARRLLELMPRQGETTSVIAWFYQELRERRYSEALGRIEDTPFKVIGTPWAMSPQTLLEAQAYELMGDKEKAHEYYDKARFLLERLARMETSDPRRRMPLALAYAGLGRKEEAIQQARKAVELASATPDALNGPAFLEHLAEVYARVGEKQAAIEQLEELLTLPCTLSPHLLRIEPRWDPLRGEAGFEALLGE
jgi:serine/threonine-protein kinase